MNVYYYELFIPNFEYDNFDESGIIISDKTKNEIEENFKYKIKNDLEYKDFAYKVLYATIYDAIECCDYEAFKLLLDNNPIKEFDIEIIDAICRHTFYKIKRKFIHSLLKQGMKFPYGIFMRNEGDLVINGFCRRIVNFYHIEDIFIRHIRRNCTDTIFDYLDDKDKKMFIDKHHRKHNKKEFKKIPRKKFIHNIKSAFENKCPKCKCDQCEKNIVMIKDNDPIIKCPICKTIYRGEKDQLQTELKPIIDQYRSRKKGKITHFGARAEYRFYTRHTNTISGWPTIVNRDFDDFLTENEPGLYTDSSMKGFPKTRIFVYDKLHKKEREKIIPIEAVEIICKYERKKYDSDNQDLLYAD